MLIAAKMTYTLSDEWKLTTFAANIAAADICTAVALSLTSAECAPIQRI